MAPFRISPTVKWLIIVNLAVWILFQIMLEGYLKIPFTEYFALIPAKVFFHYSIWQFFTYMFLHSLSVSHIIFNCILLWFVGSELEWTWGRKKFLYFYLLSGVGAGILYVVLNVAWALLVEPGNLFMAPVLGASGAIFGLMLAYGMVFGERTVHFAMLIPMKAKHFIMILGAIEVLSLLASGVGGGSNVANLAHLGGILSGYLILKFWQRPQSKTKIKSKLKLVVDNEKKATGSGHRPTWH
jgi:membrane associated rhomboid family serine protease